VPVHSVACHKAHKAHASIGAFFLLFSVYLQSALHLNALVAGTLFLPFGVGFLIGPLLTPYLRQYAEITLAPSEWDVKPQVWQVWQD